MTEDRSGRVARLRPATTLTALGLTVLALGVTAPNPALGAGIVSKIRCGDVAGLTQTIAGARAPVVINLNADNVRGCKYNLVTPYLSTPDGLPPITSAITISGNASEIIRTGPRAFRILEVRAGGTLVLANAAITNGALGDIDAVVGGGGLSIAPTASATLDGTTVSANSADLVGGGIASAGELTLINSTVSGNFLSGGASPPTCSCDLPAQEGGGIINHGGIATLVATTIDQNCACGYFASPGGGGVFNEGGTVLMQAGSSITNNRAGGIFGGAGGGAVNDRGRMVLSGTTVSGNSVGGLNSGLGGGIFNAGELGLIGGTVSNNVAVFFEHGGSSSGGGIYNTLVAVAIGVTFANNQPDNCAPHLSVPGCLN